MLRPELKTGNLKSPNKPGHRNMKMPEKDPSLWAAVLGILSNPTCGGAVMAVFVSLLRALWEAKETSKTRILLESLICGALSLSASSVIEWMNWPLSLSIGAGGTIGFIGVTVIRELIVKFLGKKVDSAS